MKIYPECWVIALASYSLPQNEYRGIDGHEDVIMIMKDASRIGPWLANRTTRTDEGEQLPNNTSANISYVRT